MPRLFVAAYPSAAAIELISELPRPQDPGVRWVPPHQWHVTLRFFGDAVEEDARHALADVVAPPAVAEVGPAVSKLGRDVVCLPVAGLEDLAAVVRSATGEVGEPPDPRPFAGHLTLARLRRRGSCGLAGTPLATTFPVAEVALVRSTLRSEGAVHEVVETRALLSSPPS